jgi:ureidoacrylate peracid hydrolase
MFSTGGKKMKTALLVIDMQNDFVEDGALIEVKGIRNRITQFKSFIDECRKRGITIIYTKHIFDTVHNPVEAKLFPSLAIEGLREGTKGVEVHNELLPEKSDIMIKKRRYDAFFGTDLEVILKAKGIKNIIITGTMTNVCCESTARSAMFRDFNVLFSSDLTFTSDPVIHENTLKTIKSHFGEVMNSEEILQSLQRP